MKEILSMRLPAIDEREQQIADWYVLLWSQSQNSFHQERVRHMLQSNRAAYGENRRMDYVPIFFGTADACSEVADKLRNTLAARVPNS